MKSYLLIEYVEIPGIPIVWSTHKGYGKRSYSKHTTQKKIIQGFLRSKYGSMRLKIPLKIDFEFHLPIPKYLSKKNNPGFPTKRPDRSNMLKFAEDYLTDSLIDDDNLIIEGSTKKMYAKVPKTCIWIYEIISSI